MAPILAERARVEAEQRAAQRAAQAEQARVEAELQAAQQADQAGVGPERQAARTAGFYRDPASGLVMQFGRSPDRQNQAESRVYCSQLPLAGGGWRLPTKDELLVVYANRRYLEPYEEWLWSTTPLAGSPSVGWVVYFSSGGAGSGDVTSTYGRARCVR